MEATLDLISRNTLEPFNSRSHLVIVIDVIGGHLFEMEESLPQGSLKSTSLIDKRKSDTPILGSQDRRRWMEFLTQRFR